MAFTAIQTQLWEVIEQSTAGTGGRTTTYRVGTIKAEACDRRQTQTHIVSNDVSAVSILMSPLGLNSSLASNLLFLLATNYPIQVQFGTSGAVLSNVRSLAGSFTFSALFITTGSNAATVLTEIVGGSAAVVTMTLPGS